MKLKENTFFTPEFTDEELGAIHTLICAFYELAHAAENGESIEPYEADCILEFYDSLKEIMDYMEHYHKE